MITRRASLTALAALALTACGKKKAPAPRCAHCGMPIDPASPWRAELLDGSAEVVGSFDSPKCALLTWRSGKLPAASHVRVQDFYDREWHDGGDLRFALGSDVVGPMGNDVVPVDPPRAAKFATDHHASRVVGVDDLTDAVLEAL